MAQQKWIPLVSMRMRVLSLAPFSRLRIWHCHELWYRSHLQFGSGVVAVAYAGSCSSDSTPSLGTSICHKCGSKKIRKKEGRKDGSRKRGRKKERKDKVRTFWIIVNSEVANTICKSTTPQLKERVTGKAALNWAKTKMQCQINDK